MIKKWKNGIKWLGNKLFPTLMATAGQAIIKALLWTCHWEVDGLDYFKKIADHEKCILILWHNRLAIIPSILYKFAPHFIYTAFVSKSRDGDLISAVIHSYAAGKTIRVAHNARHQALRELMRYLEEKKEVIIMTPDGPRGPRYEAKPGVALAAIKTQAHIVPLTWTSSRFWEFKTWDRLRLPKPFSTIKVTFKTPLFFANEVGTTLQQVQDTIQSSLPTT